MNYFAQPGHATAERPRHSQAQWVIAQIPVFWQHFRARFIELWETRAAGDAYAPSMFDDGPGRAAMRAERERFVAGLYGDMLAFAGVKMIRRILGFAHNIDFEQIADPDRRAASESATLELARRLLVSPQDFHAIEALPAAAQAIAVRSGLSHRETPV
jgi:5-methylthioribose kinase